MATDFPTNLQDMDATRGSSGQRLNDPNHIIHHALEDDTLEALQIKVGVDSSTNTDTIDYKLKNTSSVSPGHKHVIDDSTDVDTTGKADGDFLSYDQASGDWKPASTSAPDSSTTVKGVTKMSVAPVSASSPIAVGDNDDRVPTTNGTASLDGADSPGATNLTIVESNLTGIVLPFAGTTAPTGWLLSYGQAVSRATYSALFAVISTTYGVGDGSTTFNLPDMRGNIPLGKDNMGGSSRNRVTASEADTLGDEEGEEDHALITAEMPAHTHTMTGSWATGSGPGSTVLIAGGTTATSSTGGDTAHNNMQPYMTLNYIIKT